MGWAGNENCQQVTWEDCKLVDVPKPITVPTYTCTDDAAISYSVPSIKTVEVTGRKTRCAPSAYPVCETTFENACVETEVEECSDDRARLLRQHLLQDPLPDLRPQAQVYHCRVDQTIYHSLNDICLLHYLFVLYLQIF